MDKIHIHGFRAQPNVVFIPRRDGRLVGRISCAPWLTRRKDDEVIPAGTCLGLHYAGQRPIAICPACSHFLAYIRGERG